MENIQGVARPDSDTANPVRRDEHVSAETEETICSTPRAGLQFNRAAVSAVGVESKSPSAVATSQGDRSPVARRAERRNRIAAGTSDDREWGNGVVSSPIQS